VDEEKLLSRFPTRLTMMTLDLIENSRNAFGPNLFFWKLLSRPPGDRQGGGKEGSIPSRALLGGNMVQEWIWWDERKTALNKKQLIQEGGELFGGLTPDHS